MEKPKSVDDLCREVRQPIPMLSMLLSKSALRFWPMLVPLELGMMNYGAMAVWYFSQNQDSNPAVAAAMSIPLVGFMCVGALNKAGVLKLSGEIMKDRLNRKHPNFERNEAAVHYTAVPTLKDYVVGAVDGAVAAAVMMAPGALVYGAVKAYESLDGKLF